MPTATKPASPKQIAFIEKLIGRKCLTADDLDFTRRAIARGLDSRESSRMIEWLLAFSDKPLPESEKAKPGYYVREEAGDREFIVVVENKAKTSTYAKRLTQYGTKWTWEYAPGVGRTLAGMAPLTIEEAAKFGHLHGVCVVCAKELTNPKSVQAGIGPVCAKRLA